MEPSPEEAVSIRRALKRLRAEPVAFGPITTGGHTPARRWVVTLADGRTAFVKAATDELTASWIRDEHLSYSLLRGAPFMPGYIGFYDDGSRPVLAIEDLSGAEWPPPWSPERVRAVLDCLDEVAATDPPDGLPRAADDHLGLRDGWREIERDPAPFLRLGLCSERWLSDTLPTLLEASRSAPLDGEDLLHFDVRSDNVCFRDGRALLVDWNWTSVGNRWLDVAAWLPSLHAEGGPPPEVVAPDVPPGLATVVASYLCAHACLPPIPTAPNVRPAQLRQARTALPWAASALGLRAPG
ncbi:MAG TPA: aminoglycoside phosphotransferase family protein [Actinomycetota bacterium]